MRIGIIGTGAMGKNHLRVVDSMPHLQLTCANDVDEKNLDAACEPYDIKKYNDYKEMVDDVDAVMVATPTENHFAISEFFLKNKKHVLIEKPITNTLEEADALIALAKENNVKLGVGHLERFNPAVEYIQPMVKKPLFIEIQRLGPFSPRSLDVDVIMDLMIHDLDIILNWDKSGLKQINASGVPIVSNKIDIANVRLQFNSKMVASITASRVSQKKTRKLRVFQKNQYISLDYQIRRVKMFAMSKGEIVEDIPKIEEVEPLYNLWNNFYKTITTDTNYNVTGEDARRALDLALQISAHIKKNMEEA
ncbi:MAG: Gfo/Idh/MocA family oxidoreductase [bacterium]|nr:Gfo/Idh/MocA family oxidoreductase [bacterium]